jgi:hypothetical protein
VLSYACGRSALPWPNRAYNDLWTADEDLRVVLMLQRRVHQPCDLQERTGVVAVREPRGPLGTQTSRPALAHRRLRRPRYRLWAIGWRDENTPHLANRTRHHRP